MKLADRWILLFLDIERDDIIKTILAGSPVSLIYFDKSMCCSLSQRNCDDCPSSFDASKYFFLNFMEHITNSLNIIYKDSKHYF